MRTGSGRHEGDPELLHVQRGTSQKLTGVEEISAGPSREKRRDLTCREFVFVQHFDGLGLVVNDDERVTLVRGPQRSAEHEVNVDLEDGGAPQGGGVRQTPLSARVLRRGPLHGQSSAADHLRQRCIDFRPLGHHRRPVERPDVV